MIPTSQQPFPAQPTGLLAQDNFLHKPSQALTPHDRWLQKQLATLQEYQKLAHEYEMQKRLERQKKGQAEPAPGAGEDLFPPCKYIITVIFFYFDIYFLTGGGQSANFGPDPHMLGRRRKKTKEEFQQELFLRKRSRKNLRNLKFESFDLDALEMADSDFSSGDGDDFNFFCSSQPRNGGIANGGFQPDHHNFETEVEKEKKKKEKKKKKKEKKEKKKKKKSSKNEDGD